MFENAGWGKQRRLSEIVGPDGRALMLAIDHGYFMGPVSGMERPAEAVKDLLPLIDSLMLSPGILTSSLQPSFGKGIVLRASGGNSILDADMDNERLIMDADQALALDASAVAVSVFVGADHGHQTILNLAEMVRLAARLNLPVLGVTAVGKALQDKKEKRYLAHASRICAELGADIVKTYYCAGFAEVVAKTPVPIVVAGGPKLDTYKDVLELTYNALQEGAIGVDMGRNVWQSEYPSAILAGVRAVIHENITVKQALELVESLQTPERKRKDLFAVSKEDQDNARLH